MSEKDNLFYEEIEAKLEYMKQHPIEEEKETISSKLNKTFSISLGLIGSLPRQMQNFSNDLTVQNKKAGYWKTRTGIKLTVLVCAILFVILLFVLMVSNY